jgi:hypothetical protein
MVSPPTARPHGGRRGVLAKPGCAREHRGDGDDRDCFSPEKAARLRRIELKWALPNTGSKPIRHDSCALHSD